MKIRKIIYAITTLGDKTTFFCSFILRFFLNFNTKYVILHESKEKNSTL